MEKEKFELRDRERITFEQEFRNKIAEILASCLSANDVCPRVKEVLDAFQDAGYTRKPELPSDTVEAVAKLTEDRFRSPAESAGLVWDANFNYMLAQEIIELFPEYEPVELEALGNEERIKVVVSYHFSGGESWHKLANEVSKATNRKNQAKGQLYRLKE